MISAEISQVLSCQQDMTNLTLEDTPDLQTQANQTLSQIELYESLLKDLDLIQMNCGDKVCTC